MKKEMGHKFLKNLGKTRLRPGGIKGTNFLFAHIEFKKGDRILEVACNRGINLLALAKQYPKTTFIGIDVDKVAILEAQLEAMKNNLSNIEFIRADAFHLEFPENSFDYIINEAMLTMFSNKSKTKALSEYYRVLKPGGLLLTHDILLLNNYDKTKKQLSDAINVNVSPLSKEDWLLLFEEAEFKTVNCMHDKLTLLTVSGLLADEGVINSLRIIKNGFKKDNRKQFIKMGTTFKKLEKDMNFICFVNKKVL